MGNRVGIIGVTETKCEDEQASRRTILYLGLLVGPSKMQG
jgi:hypothetical protein